MSPELTIVYEYARNAHESQLRHADVPYITHCVHVCDIVENFGKVENFDVLTAQKIALLHDTLEDTNITYNELKNIFGKAVADGVKALTKNYDLDKKYRLDECLNRILKSSREAMIVKVADRADNIKRPNPEWDHQKHISYYADSEKIYNVLGSKFPNIQPFLKKSLSRYKNIIESNKV